MPPVRERPKSQKVRENESTAALLATPRRTPRAPSRPRAPQKTPSRRLNTQDLLSKVQTLQAASRARGALPTPDETTRSTRSSTQVVRDSVPPPAPIPLYPRPSLDLSSTSSEPPASDIEMELELHQSIEDLSDKGVEEEAELDYDIEWKVLLGKEPIISDIISRSGFLFATLCWKAKEKAQIHTNKKKRDAEVLNCKAQMASKRDKAFEFTIEKGDDMAKIDKKYRQLRDDGKTDIRVYIFCYLESVERIDENEETSTDEDEMALTQIRTASQAGPVSTKKNKNKKKDKQRSTATTQLRAEEPGNEIRDAVSKSYAVEIARNNRCSSGNCPNKGYACIAYGEHAHIRLNSDILKKWDKAINKGRVTAMEPPRYLVGKLLEGISARKAAKKDKQDEKSDVRGLTININSGSVPVTKESAEVPLRSSPVNLTGDVDLALVQFIEEMCEKRPLSARQFRETLQKLQDETLGFNDLDLIEEKGWWPRFGTIGVASALMKERKRFQRDQDTRVLVEQAGQPGSSTEEGTDDSDEL
jgi:hypothetical protein